MREALLFLAGAQEIDEVLDLGQALRGKLLDLVEQDLIGCAHGIDSFGFLLLAAAVVVGSARSLGDHGLDHLRNELLLGVGHLRAMSPNLLNAAG
jgi:hypothetical protein